MSRGGARYVAQSDLCREGSDLSRLRQSRIGLCRDHTEILIKSITRFLPATARATQTARATLEGAVPSKGDFFYSADRSINGAERVDSCALLAR